MNDKSPLDLAVEAIDKKSITSELNEKIREELESMKFTFEKVKGIEYDLLFDVDGKKCVLVLDPGIPSSGWFIDDVDRGISPKNAASKFATNGKRLLFDASLVKTVKKVLLLIEHEK